MKPFVMVGGMFVWLWCAGMAGHAQDSLTTVPMVAFGPGMADASGVITHVVRSSRQSEPTELRVLLPRNIESGQRLPIIYLLPVEAKRESRYGDPLAEILKTELHREVRAIFVAPTFSELPWYADHPTRLDCQQESYFVEEIVPYIDRTYSTVATREGRLLLGFSKSGWGSWSLLLRHPVLFGKALAWDAPLMMDRPGLYGSGPIFGTTENFSKYQLTQLLQDPPAEVRTSPRLILTGYGNFRSQHLQMAEFLEQRGLPHQAIDGPERSHDWHSGWVREAVIGLLGTPSPSP